MLNNLKKIIDKSPICIMILDKYGVVIYHNDIVEKRIGKKLIGLKLVDEFKWKILEYIDIDNTDKIVLEKSIKDKNDNDIELLINAYVYEKKYIVCYCTNITKIKNYNKNMKYAFSQLEESKRKAEMSDKLKSSFLASVSHEIRTPLNAIIGFSKLLLKNNKNDKEKYVDIIEKNSESLTNLIDDIIDLSKIEVNEISIKSNKCILIELMSELYNNHYNKTKDNVKLILDENLTNVIIYTDLNRLKQILNNLISNSIKFTHNGYIKIGYKLEQNVIIFYVQDSGIGIDKRDYEYIFERFTQLDSKDSKKYGGTGLGLSITKKLVELLGGKIWLESELDKGSIFYFTIPSDYVQKISNEYDNIDKFEKRKLNWQNKNILIVEDDDYSSMILMTIIKKTNANCKIVKNGLDAIKEIKNNEYDAIILDLKLPDIHGYDLLKKIKNLKKIPIISQIPLKTNELINEIFKKGFDDFVLKPVETYNLLKKLNKYINN